MQTISSQQLNVDRSSYVDPNGFVFHHEDEIFRGIYPEVQDFYQELFDRGTIDSLIQNFGLVESSIADFRLQDSSVGMVLKHRKISPVSFCTEWSPSMLKAAGQLTLDLTIELLKNDLTLQDAYPWNIVFDGPTPRFVDFTSIVSNDAPMLWPAYQQFMNCFYYPLMMSVDGKGSFVRLAMNNYIDGLDVQETYKLMDLGTFFRNPGKSFSIYLSVMLNAFLQNRPELKVKLTQTIQKNQKKPNTSMQLRFLKNLSRRFSKMNYRKSSDHWNNYYQWQDPTVDFSKKIEAIESALQTFQPKTVLDIGCNTGRFSILAAKSGARVTSLDSSESCIDSLYQYAAKEKLTILPLVVNALAPTPSSGFMGQQFSSLMDRAPSDVVFCLGLMHHLHINGRQPFSKIAELLASLTRKGLVFEYVDLQDDNNNLLDHGRKISYSIETVKEALGKYFQIEEFESDRTTRRILICQLKNPRSN